MGSQTLLRPHIPMGFAAVIMSDVEGNITEPWLVLSPTEHKSHWDV